MICEEETRIDLERLSNFIKNFNPAEVSGKPKPYFYQYFNFLLKEPVRWPNSKVLLLPVNPFPPDIITQLKLSLIFFCARMCLQDMRQKTKKLLSSTILHSPPNSLTQISLQEFYLVFHLSTSKMLLLVCVKIMVCSFSVVSK